MMLLAVAALLLLTCSTRHKGGPRGGRRGCGRPLHRSA